MFGEAYLNYKNNFVTALAFALLLVFIPIFAMVANTNIESGTIIVDYSLMAGDAFGMAIVAGLVVLFLFFYSMFTSIMIFAVRREQASVKLKYHLMEQIEKFSFKVFFFYLILAAVIFAINVAAIGIGLNVAVSAGISFIIAALFLFVPQSIVIDEFSVGSAIAANLDFISKNAGYLLYVLFVGAAFVGLTAIVEFAVDNFIYAGHYLTPIIVLVFIVPFIECLKAVIYLRKFELLVARAD